MVHLKNCANGACAQLRTGTLFLLRLLLYSLSPSSTTIRRIMFPPIILALLENALLLVLTSKSNTGHGTASKKREVKLSSRLHNTTWHWQLPQEVRQMGLGFSCISPCLGGQKKKHQMYAFPPGNAKTPGQYSTQRADVSSSLKTWTPTRKQIK